MENSSFTNQIVYHEKQQDYQSLPGNSDIDFIFHNSFLSEFFRYITSEPETGKKVTGLGDEWYNLSDTTTRLYTGRNT